MDNSKDFVVVSKGFLLSLMTEATELDHLRISGVDNWEWYGEGRKEYVAQEMGVSIEEVRENEYDYEDAAKAWYERAYNNHEIQYYGTLSSERKC
jgi:hypothetical protein